MKARQEIVISCFSQAYVMYKEECEKHKIQPMSIGEWLIGATKDRSKEAFQALVDGGVIITNQSMYENNHKKEPTNQEFETSEATFGTEIAGDETPTH